MTSDFFSLAMAAIGQQVGQDYTEQWINYYRQMGYPKEADAIEQNKVVLSSSSDVGQFNSLVRKTPFFRF
jgi:aminopeptidase N